MTENILELTADHGGRWLVETVSGSRHIFDLDAGTYGKAPRPRHAGRLPENDVRAVSEIERWPRINAQFSIWVDARDRDGDEDHILSSYVTRIMPLADGKRVPLATQSLNQAVGQAPPVNAWLLVGDEASYPTDAELAAQRRSRDPDLWVWTVPRQVQRGDLMLLYFMAPRKAVCFAARAVLPPVYDPTMKVNALKHVDPHQWWTELTPFVPLPPVSYSTLKDLHGGHLILRGKPTTYITPDIVDAMVEHMGPLSDEQRLVVKRPTGDPALPDPSVVSFAQWRRMSGGPLGLEAQVERYVVEPLLRMCLGGRQGVTWQKSLRIPGVGVADYGVTRGSTLTAVVEVKIGVRVPRGRDWRESPDFNQVMRYSDATGLPAVLVDSTRTYLIRAGATAPHRWIERASASASDLEAIGAHLAAER